MKNIKKKLLAHTLILGMILPAFPSYVAHAAEGISLDEDNFPDANFREYVADQIDTDGDGELSEEECNAVTCIDVSDKQIANLDGIRYFPYLTELNCNNNILFELDLSSNTNLTKLNCGLNALTELDFYWNEKLTDLDCSFNTLTYLNVSENYELLSLNCASNNLDNLDLGYNEALEDLKCNSNQLKFLDLRNNISLESVRTDEETITVLGDSDLGWITKNGNRYYVIDDHTTPKRSHMAVGLTKIDGEKYVFDSDGIFLSDIILPKEITILPSAVTLTKWDTVSLAAVTEPEGVPENQLLWETSNDYIAEVSPKGVITPNETGTAFISVSSFFDVSVMYTIPVTVKPVITLVDSGEITLLTGAQKEIRILENTDKVSSITCESEDPDIVTVSSDLIIQGVSEGETYVNITVSNEAGDTEEYSVYVNVLDESSLITNVSRMELYYDGELIGTEDELPVYVDSSINIVAIAYTDDGEEYEFSRYLSSHTMDDGVICAIWESSDPMVATVIEGQVNAVCKGRTLITARIAGTEISESVEVSVSERPINLSELSIVGNDSVKVGDTTTLSVVYTPSNATNRDVQWESDNPEIATVDDQGNVTGVSVGTARIEACSEKDSYIFDSFLITVGPKDDWITIDEAHFPDDSFRDYVSRDLDENLDGYLSIEERDSISEITTGYSDIESFAGIELFPNLTDLDCSGNSLSDISSIQVDGLKRLICRDCEITELDVTGYPLLTELDCAGNKLTDLDISRNPKLIRLNCNGNELVSLNLSDNSDLEYLDCQENKLKTLSLTQAPELIELNCYDNEIKELDLTRNPKLSYLNCGYNYIELIDLRNTKAECDHDWQTIVLYTDDDLGWNTSDGYTYYLVDDGKIPKSCHRATGLTEIDGKKYLFDENGVLETDIVIPWEIMVQPSSVTMTLSDTETLEVETDPEGVSNNELVWKSGNESIVKVDEYGELTPVAIGTTTVTVSSVYDKSVMYIIPVTIRPLITLESTEMEFLIGEKRENKITQNTTKIDDITWVIDDPSVVSVDSGLSIDGKSEGETSITLTVTDYYGRSEQYVIHVTVSGIESMNTDIERIELYCDGERLTGEEEISVFENENMELTAMIYTSDDEVYEYSFDNSTIHTNHGRINLTWNSSNSEVATVNRGNVDFGSAGRVFISAQAVGSAVLSDVIEIVVAREPNYLQWLSLSSVGLFDIGQKERLTCRFTPMNADNKEVYWESDDPGIVEVNEYGMITAKGTGKTTVRVVSKENEGIESWIEVEVIAVHIKNISISQGTRAFSDGDPVFRETKQISGNDALILKHNVDEEVYIRTKVNEDADRKEIDYFYDDHDDIGMVPEDVTDEFTGLSDGERIMRIQAEEIGEASVFFYALDNSGVTAELNVEVVPYDEWYVNQYGDRRHYTKDVMDTGKKTISGKTYYFDEDGIMQTGWQTINDKLYFFDTNGSMKTGWITSGGKKYYADNSGIMQTGWQKLSGKWYYFGNDGVMRTGWNKLSGKWCYFDTKGVLCTGWKQIGKKWYLFNANGYMQTGWKKSGISWYYFGADGAMVTGWKKVGGKWYYFKAGAMVSGWQQIGSKWYYFPGGAMKTGWLKSGGNWYYFNKDGEMVTGSMKIGTTIYNFSSSGVCLNP